MPSDVMKCEIVVGQKKNEGRSEEDVFVCVGEGRRWVSVGREKKTEEDVALCETKLVFGVD